jgi:hypothetical protein
MKGQSAKEMLEIAIPFGLAIGAFVVLMGGFFTTTISVAQTFVPYKVAAMVAHTLTGSTKNLVLDGGIPHKGLLDINKIEQFSSSYASSLPPSTNMPCWTFRAIIKDLETEQEYYFGYKSTDEDFWSGEPESINDLMQNLEVEGFKFIVWEVPESNIPVPTGTVDIRRTHLPVLIDLNGTRHLGKMTIDVRTKDMFTCQAQIEGIAVEVAS